jgi:hypothetical protein
MPFVRRNADGKIDAVFENPEGDATEEISADNSELNSFLGTAVGDSVHPERWAIADLAIARVTEDLIDLLIDKGVISFTELPENAQQKLIDRRGLRNELGYVARFVNEDEEIL